MEFKLGNIYVTRGIDEVSINNEHFSIEISVILTKYRYGDWGDCCEEDINTNNEAVINGFRIFAAYNTSKGRVFVITEADRSSTTILFADEY